VASRLSDPSGPQILKCSFDSFSNRYRRIESGKDVHYGKIVVSGGRRGERKGHALCGSQLFLGAYSP